MINLKNGRFVLKIADFGLSKPLDDRSMTSNVGSPAFKAPEVEAGSKYYGLSADIWSAGIIAYLLGVGEHPPKEGMFCSMTMPHLLYTFLCCFLNFSTLRKYFLVNFDSFHHTFDQMSTRSLSFAQISAVLFVPAKKTLPVSPNFFFTKLAVRSAGPVNSPPDR